MKKEYQDLIEEHSKHDCALMYCEGSVKFIRCIVQYWFTAKLYDYKIYRLDGDFDFNIDETSKDKCLLFVSDSKDNKCLEQDLFRAKIGYQLKHTLFVPKDTNNLKLVLSGKKIIPQNIILFDNPNGVMLNGCLRDEAYGNMIVKIPRCLPSEYLNKYLEIYGLMAKPEYKSSEVRKRVIKECAEKGIIDKFEILKRLLIAELGLELILCSKGNFVMGCPENEEGKEYEYKDESQREVEISNPFMIGKYPVTQLQYETVCGNNPSKARSIFSCEHLFRPVENVSFCSAKGFCETLNSDYADYIPEGYCFDLPKESQWEYACRAGTKTALNSGKNLNFKMIFTREGDFPPEYISDELDEIAWNEKNSERSEIVGLKKPNLWGLYDMHGNVYEWCINDQNRKDVSDKDVCVAKGGSWRVWAALCRSASYIIINDSFSSYSDIGFRVALVSK